MDVFDPRHVRIRETYSFPALRGRAKEDAVREWQRVAPLIHRLLGQPYEWKLAHARAVIETALARCTRPAVAWSGGRGSTVLLHLVRQAVPDVLVLFGNTGVEFPETVRFVRETARAWWLDLHEARPETTFWRVTREQGFPLLGKVMASHTAEYWRRQAQERLRRREEATGQMPLFPREVLDELTTSRKAQIAEVVKLSASCCYHLKEKPQREVQWQLGVDMLFLGIQVEESDQRRKNYVDFGELYYGRKARAWIAHPLALWTRGDLLRYEAEHGLPHNPLYDVGYERVGCWPCLMMLASSSNHLDMLARNHPNLHRMLMVKTPAGEAIARIQAIFHGLDPDAFLRAWSVEELYERYPCWFNSLRRREQR